MSQFLKEVGEEGMMYALIPCKKGLEEDGNVLIELQEALSEFANLMPEDLLPGLPPMRDIQHHIDFVPGSILPNRPAYRLSPKESEELQCQVTELLERQHSREYESLCSSSSLSSKEGRFVAYVC